MSERPYLVGYADPWSVRAGGRVEVMVASNAPATARAHLVRLGPGDPSGHVSESEVQDLGALGVGPQRTSPGSCAVVPGGVREWPAGPFVVAAFCMPTRPQRRQALVSQVGDEAAWWLGIDDSGRPCAGARTAGGSPRKAKLGAPAEVLTTAEALTTAEVLTTGRVPLVEGAWYLLAAGFEPGGRITLHASALEPSASWRTEETLAVGQSDAVADGDPVLGGLLAAPFVLGAVLNGDGSFDGCLDGKLEAPAIFSGELAPDLAADLRSGRRPVQRLLVGWDFRPGPPVALAAVGAVGCDARLRNSPMAAVTGHNWQGSEVDYRLVPEQYAALHLHSDDLDDCEWSPTLGIELAADLRSGAYALRLEVQGNPPERVPFFVRPSAGPTAPLMFLVPTASYLAYANDHPVADGDFSEATAGRSPVLYEDDLLLHEHREWGLSCYDSHLDGSGVAMSSWRRPMLNLRPTHLYHVGPWQLAADLALLGWLDELGIDYDVATDHDLHDEGEELFSGYRAVVTGTHPEYYSSAMLEAVERWTRSGGRLAYLGANGFYWRVAFDPHRPHVMELRRGQAGSRAWESAPGEGHLAFTGEPGGLWRHLGHPPQKLTGVGYAAQGFDQSGWYRRLPGSEDKRAAWIFEGVEEEIFGTVGSIAGGAVGQELDRYDAALGSPLDALVLATSEGLTESYLRCVEEVPFSLPGVSALVDPAVRADVVYHVKPGGGAVFATGSIAWSGALGFDPAIGRITENVLRRFVDPAPLAW